MRRVRATFLLRCVLLAASVGVFAAVVFATQSIGWTVATTAVVVAVWVVGIECDLLPIALEHFAVRRASRTGRPVSLLWFVDLDEKGRLARQAFHDETRDNPTIR
jgi:hypothetical protein